MATTTGGTNGTGSAPRLKDVAEAAVDALLHRIDAGYAEPGRLIQPGHRLVIRDSSRRG